MKSQRINLVLFDTADLLDFGGAAGVFTVASRLALRAGAAAALYETVFLSPAGGLVRTLEGLSVETVPLRPLIGDEVDTIIVSGGELDATLSQHAISDWLRANRQKVRRIGAVCTGTFVLAEAGLLDGLRAVTHWEDCAQLQERYPAIQVDPEPIFVEDQNVWTSAGVTAGIDMAVAMVEADHGHELAFRVCRQMVVFLQRPGGQAQFSTLLQSQATTGRLAPLLNWMRTKPCEDLRVEALAERANMTVRSLYRAFEDATGMPPAEWVERLRVETAKRLLEQTAERVDQVALQAGFPSYETMRRAFARNVGVSPVSYRGRFGRRAVNRPAHPRSRGAFDGSAAIAAE